MSTTSSSRTSAVTTTTEELTTVRATTTRRLVAGRNGRYPWGWRRLILWAALPLFGLLALVSTLWGVDHIEDRLVADATADLEAAGIDPSGLDIDFDYRDGTATGVLPAGVELGSADAAVAEQGLLRNFEIDADAAPAAPAAPAPGGPVTVDVTFDGTQVVVDGTVLDDGQRATVLEAVAAGVGSAEVTVVDRLEVSGLEAEVDGADARIAALTTALGTLSGASAWQASLTDSALGLVVDDVGTAPIEPIEGLTDSITAIPTVVTVMSPGDPEADRAAADDETVTAEISSLQNELDVLAAEIRETVVFSTGSSDLSAEARATLDKVADAMGRYPLPVVEVAGHTDDRGPAEANRVLSQSRATAVARYLVDAGVDADRLQARGAGETEPIDDNGTAEGRANNRRVQLTAFDIFPTSD